MKIKDLKYFAYMTIVFTILIFLSNSFIYKEDKSYIEENFIDKQQKEQIDSLSWAIKKQEISNKALISHIQSKSKTLNSASRLEAIFEPENYESKIDKSYFYLLQDLLESSLFDSVFYDAISWIETHLYQDKADVRWKMKNRSIHIFAPETMSKWEFLSVYIHELWHYIDLYVLQKDVIWDDSDYFYDISWTSVKTIKKWSSAWDFVSWYSMTNKYEDFAETFTYYVLHNKSFLERAWKSDTLAAKYKFFSKYVFRDGQFKDTFFAYDDKIKDYYRDITKIKINYNKFLQYLKK